MDFNVLDARVRRFHSPPIYLGAADIEDVGTCPACASTAGQKVISLAEGQRSRSLAISHCSSCSHAYLSRRPSQAWFQRYYSEEWDTGRVPSSALSLGGMRSSLRQSAPVRRAVRAARVLRHDLPQLMHPGPSRLLQMVSGLGDVVGDLFPRGQRLLEIGAGYGAALTFFQEAGLDVYGTEASSHRVQACTDQGLRVVQTSITDLDPIADRGPFDFVYSSHVFEHLTDLASLMTSVQSILKPDGFIYLEVPHSPVAEDLLLRTHIPVHLHLFSAASLSTVLRRFGFQPVRVLADVNLHVVAQRSDVALVPIGEVRIPSEPADLIHGLDVIDADHGPTRVSYSQYDVEITRLADGSRPLYTRQFPYGVWDTPEDDRNEFVLEMAEGSSPGLPVRFLYGEDEAPIWVKHG